MPIEVRHGPPAGIEALAGLMTGMGRGAISETEARRIGGRQIAAQEAQAARQREQIRAQQAAQAAQLNAQRAAQMRQIEAQADRQKEAADTAYQRTALAAGLQEEIQEQQFDNQIEKMQEAARLQASQFEYQYTAQQRQKMARNNDARQMVRSNPDFSEAEKVTMLRAIDMDDMGITPGAVPADPNKPVYPDGQGIGAQWTDEEGNRVTRNEKGVTQVQVPFDKTSAGIKQKHEQAMELRGLERQEEFRDKIAAERAKIASTLMEFEGVDESGERTLQKRYPTPAEVWARLQIAYPPSTWPERETEGPGMERGPTDAQLEEARNFLREMRAKRDRGEGLFPDEILAVQEAGRLLRGSIAGGGP